MRSAPNRSRRWPRAACLGALVAAGTTGTGGAQAGGPPELNARCSELACRVERVPATWQLLAVHRDLRGLKLAYESGGCRRGNGRATVDESSSHIHITVDQEEVVALDTPDGKVVCTQELRYRVLHLRLRRPVAGRRIEGGPRIRGEGLAFDRTVTEGGRVVPLVPRVLDLAAADARTVLEFQSFAVRRIGKRSGRVAFQSPLPGRRASGRVVRLTIGRRSFDQRSITGCVERAGIPVRAGRPEPGDADAPDLELQLQRADAWGFVALYADRLRARELEPSIRRNARAFGGIVERRGRVTIVWVRWPDAGLRARLLGCLAGRLP